jgi:hypothetical protein
MTGETTNTASCKDCHGTYAIVSSSDPNSSVNRRHLSATTCGQCHSDEHERYSRSAHGIALQGGIQGAPSCVECHGGHNGESTGSSQWVSCV